jgi:hypothetical protein
MRNIRQIATILLLLMTTHAAVAQASVTGYGAITCGELRETFNADQLIGFGAWISGYVSGQNVMAVKNGDAQYMLWGYDQEEFARLVYDACLYTPRQDVVGAIDSLVEARL